jgi:1-phosphofructokinase
MIVAVTPNPSLDKTYHIGSLARGEVIRVGAMSVEAAGKGVNVARALNANGVPAVAVVPVGGPDGDLFMALLSEAGVPFLPVSIVGNLRSNVSVVESDGTVTKLNEPGPTMSADEVEALASAAIKACVPGDWLVASGSLAPGVPSEFYAELGRRARRAGVKLALDASGPALSAGLEGIPSLVKPNADELRQITGLPLERVDDIVGAAHRLVDNGVERVLISLGGDGALLVDDAGVVYGRADVDDVRNSVGAGDTLLAGFLAGGAESRDSLAVALAWARAAVRSPNTAMSEPSEADRQAVEISDTVPADLVVQGT